MNAILGVGQKTPNRDIRSLLSDRAPASSLPVLGRFGASMSPFYTEDDLERPPSFILTKRAQAALFSGRTGCSQAACRGSQVCTSRHSHHVCAEICMVLRLGA